MGVSHSDPIEREYEVAITIALGAGDDIRAYELSVGLKQYREMYKLWGEDA